MFTKKYLEKNLFINFLTKLYLFPVFLMGFILKKFDAVVRYKNYKKHSNIN